MSYQSKTKIFPDLMSMNSVDFLVPAWWWVAEYGVNRSLGERCSYHKISTIAATRQLFDLLKVLQIHRCLLISFIVFFFLPRFKEYFIFFSSHDALHTRRSGVSHRQRPDPNTPKLHTRRDRRNLGPHIWQRLRQSRGDSPVHRFAFLPPINPSVVGNPFG